MVREYFLFNVENNCMFNSGSCSQIPTFVFAENKSEAFKNAKEFLESDRSGFSPLKVVGQRLNGSNTFLADEGTVLSSVDDISYEEQPGAKFTPISGAFYGGKQLYVKEPDINKK